MENPRYLNLTPHKVNVFMLEIPPSGCIARLESNQKLIMSTPIPVYKTEYSSITVNGKPFSEFIEKTSGERYTVYIVSTITLIALKIQGFPLQTENYIIVSPNTARAIRDENGNIIGVDSFQTL